MRDTSGDPMLQLEWFERIAAVDPARWDAATRDASLYPSSAWLATVEPNFGSEKAYVLARDAQGADSEPRDLGAMACYLVGDDAYWRFQPLATLVAEDALLTMGPSLLPPERERARELAASLRERQAEILPAAVSTVPWGYIAGFWGGTAAVRGRLLDGLDEAAGRWGARSTALLYLGEEHDDLPDLLARSGYTGFLAGANCVLSVRWSDFDGYVAGLGSKARQNLRRERARFSNYQVLTLAAGEIGEYLDQLARLSAAHDVKYGAPYEPESHKQLIEHFAASLGSHCTFVLGLRDGRLAGFVQCFRKGAVLVPKLAGFDQRCDRRDSLYFNLAFYELIDLAARAGLSEIHYGVETYDAKAYRGCRLRPLYCYVRFPPAAQRDAVELSGILDTGWRRYFERFSERFDRWPAPSA